MSKHRPVETPTPGTVVLISANAEWREVRAYFPHRVVSVSPWGEYFVVSLDVGSRQETVLFFQGGWGKIAAAASAQYVIDHWLASGGDGSLMVNLGTCGGFEGEVERGTVMLVDRTLVYDIIEQMSDYDDALEHYATALDLSWLHEPYPHPVVRGLLVSADRDLRAEDIPWLAARFGAVAGDWESGAIAHVAWRNRTPCLILRGVTDLVGSTGGEAYAEGGGIAVYHAATHRVMRHLLDHLPGWLACAR
ncbi:MAG: 5'-methylthioadenosine/S-adenosylhomocysteine nucleosidase [Chloroflexi bacterium]|nr:5'-methylthioadenosine/S-adenosylhomocysteine nucleosidase [Chloroflexota bacterium]